MPDDERICLLSFSHAANELSFLDRTLYCTKPDDADDADHTNAQQAYFFFFLRSLAGKSFESWKLIRTNYLSCILGRSNRTYLSEAGSTSLDFLKKYFGKTNVISTIRNDFASHFSPKRLDERFKDSSADLLLYFEEDRNFNTVYCFAEDLVSGEVWDFVDGDSEFAKMLTVYVEVRDVAKHLLVFIEAFLESLVDRYQLNNLAELPREIDVRGLPDFETMRMRWFVDTDRVADL